MQLRFQLTQHQPAATNAISINATTQQKKDKLSTQVFYSAKIKVER